MKKISIVILVFAMSLQAHAQGVFIQATGGYGFTSLNNKEDSKDNTFNEVNMINSYATRFGVSAGYDFGIKRMGVSRISLGIASAPIIQKYAGEELGNGNLKHDITARLNYLQIPLLIEFNVLPKGRFTPIIQFGGSYGTLRSYNIDYKVSQFDGLLTGDRTIENNDYFYEEKQNGQLVNAERSTLNEWYYKRTMLNIQGGLGCNVALTKKLELNVLSYAIIGTTDSENKVDIDYTITEGTFQGQTRVINPYQRWIGIHGRNRLSDDGKRGTTNNLNFGLQLGMTYKLFKTKNSTY